MSSVNTTPDFFCGITVPSRLGKIALIVIFCVESCCTSVHVTFCVRSYYILRRVTFCGETVLL